MRTRRGFMAALVVLFVLVSVFSSKHATPYTLTGTVVEYEAGRRITVASEQTDPGGVQFVLRETDYEGDPSLIGPGVRVRVWSRSLGERRSVADRVRVLPDGATR